MASISKRIKKIVLIASFAFVFLLGAAYSFKGYFLKQEAPKKAQTNTTVDCSGEQTILAQEDICSDENAALFVGCNGFF